MLTHRRYVHDSFFVYSGTLVLVVLFLNALLAIIISTWEAFATDIEAPKTVREGYYILVIPSGHIRA